MQFRASFLSRISPFTSPRILHGRDIRVPKPRIINGNLAGGRSVVTLIGIREIAPNEVFPEHVVYLWIPALYGVIPFAFEEIDIWPANITLNDADDFVIDVSYHFSSLVFLVDLAIDAYVQPYPMSLSYFVSNDIFVPLKEIGVQGKKYIIDEWKNAFAKEIRYKHQSWEKHLSSWPPISKAKLRKEISTLSQARRNPSFFDLIKPLLMPPPISPDDDFLWKSFLPPGKNLFDYQRIGIEKLVNNTSFLLADEMGTGKTVMAVFALRILLQRGEVKRILILAPSSVLPVWEGHLRDWSLGEVTYTLVHGIMPEQRQLIWRQDYHVFVTTYDTFRSDVQNEIIPRERWFFDLVILDEAQYIKNRKGARFQSLQKVKFIRKWALTGTPLENRIEDIKTIFDFLVPNLIPKEEKSPSRVRDYIRPYVLRRLKKDVLHHLPSKKWEWRWLKMSPEQRIQYELVSQHGVARLAELKKQKRISKPHIFTLISKLKKICNFPQGSLNSPKAEETARLVRDITAQGDKVIIFSQFIEEGIAKLAKILEGYKVVQITGSMSRRQREAAIAAFRTDPEVAVFLISLKTGGVGLTLTEANHVIHFDHWWNPAIMKQAEDRVHRPGQKKDEVKIYKLGMKDTIEERIYQILKRKRALAGVVVDSLSEDIALENLDISIDEWLHEVLQIPVNTSQSRDHVSKKHNKQQAQYKVKELNIQQNVVNLEKVREQFYLLDPREFEALVAKVFAHLGFIDVEHIGRTSDGGVDIIAKRYNKSGAIYALIQCKRYSKNVGVQVARDLAGVLSQQGENYVGYIVTSSDFTTRCKRFVANSGGRIKLINGFELARYVIQFGLDDAF